MYPMDYEEFRWALGDKVTTDILRQLYDSRRPVGLSHRKTMRDLRLYMLVGGMPQVVDTYLKTNNLSQVDKTKRGILRLYLDDFQKIDPSGQAERLFMNIPAQLSANTSRYQPSAVIGERSEGKMVELLQALSESKTAMSKADPQFEQIYQQLGQYWGEQPGTSGPVYVGAFVVFLFVLGLFIVKGPLKWALLAATILSILLSWGKNFMGLTDFFIDYVPMYAKFRTVASILVIAEFTIPLLAMLALKKLLEEPELMKPRMKYVGISFLLTGGIAMLFSLMPDAFFSSFISTSEMQALKSLPAEHIQPIMANLTEMRQAMFLLAVAFGKLKKAYAVGIILVLCLVDLWTVNKRYLNDEMFVPASEREAPQQKTQTDELILRDQSLDYRVLNLASNTFNENETSFYHKSIGGYHAAKLRRYQEVVERYINPEMQRLYKSVSEAAGDMTQVKGDSIFPVLNMLNAKYFIFPLEGGQTVPIQNPYVYGNAWFVDELRYVDDANQEMEALGQLDLRHQAVADAKFKEQLGEAVVQDTASVVSITAYEPNRLTYDVNTGKGGVLVFSEIYYPGWTATVDGQPVELGRVDYLLRAMQIAPGRHQVELSFFPKSVNTTETFAYAAYGVLILVLLGAGFMEYRRRQKKSSVSA